MTGNDMRRLLVEAPAPRVDVARGFAASADREALLERLAADPHTEKVELGAHVRALRVSRWRLDPAVAEVAVPEPVEIEGTASRTPSGTLLVDSRTQKVALRFRDRSARYELEIERGHVRLYVVGELALMLPALEPRVATGGAPLSGWLAGEIEALRESVDPVDRLAAAGLLVRFWMPTERDDPAAGAPEVVRGVRAWARAIDDDAYRELERAVRWRAERLAAALADAGEATDARARPSVLALARERDRLECVLVAMRLAGRAGDLAERLRAIDRQARAKLTALTESVASVDDRLLEAVSWSEPEAWWGCLAR